ncbi:hypothetical protein PG994_002233 [Apiospora phragmitis]|uniref:F-box domain-containing protein n=1 Tax=Apiospora phragmitis TaxID=2905665 RepID=A0ABR1WVV0_9PEZI
MADNKKLLSQMRIKTQLKYMAMKASNEIVKEAYKNIKETSPKDLTIQAVTSAFKKARKDNAKNILQKESLVSVHPNPQFGSILFKIPQEIRNEVYGYVFDSTRLWFGESGTGLPPKKSKRHSLALLTCCSRVRTEIGLTWLKRVLLCFESPELMPQKLLTIPAPISSVGHVRVHRLTGMMMAKAVLIHEFLRVLEGLCLEELTIVAGTDNSRSDYRAVELLLKKSNGWRRLTVHFQPAYPLFDGYDTAQIHNGRHRQPLPETFERLLQQRDGVDSHPIVHLLQGSTGQVVNLPVHGFRQRHFQALYKQENGVPNSDRGLQYSLLAQRGQGANVAVPPLVLPPSHRLYRQTKEQILMENRDTYDDPHEFDFGN